MEQKNENMDKKEDKENIGLPKLDSEQVNKMDDLEKRLYEFLTKNGTEGGVVTYSGTIDAPTSVQDDNQEKPEPMNFVLQLLNVFEDPLDENAAPTRARKRRTIISKQDDPNDPTGNTKRFRIFFDQNSEEDPARLIREGLLDEGAGSSVRQLEENIATIQDRIQMIKEMWMQRCGNN